jgi:hypothetical protein
MHLALPPPKLLLTGIGSACFPNLLLLRQEDFSAPEALIYSIFYH